MARTARIVVPRMPHHLTQRGNQRQQMFGGDEDYRCYLALWGNVAPQCGVRVRGYCLMPNHVHVIPVPASEDGLARAVGLIHQRYSQYLNFREGTTGHRWQNRFFSCPLDEAHAYQALRYIERNPVRAGLVAQAWDYPWSSARAHCLLEDPTTLLDLDSWRAAWPVEAWRDHLALAEEPGEIDRFRLATQVGRPLGTEEFVTNLEASTGRRLRPHPVGRPRKTAEHQGG